MMKNINRYKALLLFLCLIPLFTRLSAQPDYKGFPEWELKQQGETEYALYTPQNLEEGKVYPIALFLHGCCGEDDHARLRNAVDPPVRMWHNFGENEQTIPTYIISPASSSGWSQHFTNLKIMIDDLIANHQGDPQRIYITGFSMGGGGTFQFINAYPGYFAAAMPMGMSFSGSEELAKDIPMWANVGALDVPRATDLAEGVGNTRELNGYPYGPIEWITGVNPTFTAFDGVGHGVQWNAVSTQDLVSWAYSKVNDGNIYPNVYFEAPEHMKFYGEGENIPYEIVASDADGSIDSVKIYLNGIHVNTHVSGPYSGSLIANPGDNTLQAIAYDNMGKTNNANIIISVNNLPYGITDSLPDTRQGMLYDEQLDVKGNAPFSFILSPAKDLLPEGISLSEDGHLKGIPLESGDFNLEIIVRDKQDDQLVKEYNLHVDPKDNATVLVTSAMDNNGNVCPVSKLKDLELGFTDYGNETSFSFAGSYEGMTFIRPDHSNRDYTGDDALTFTVDEDVTVYIAYDIMDNLFTSTIPEWLSEWTKVSDEQIVAQYFYFAVYSKDFSAGTITLPGADATANGVRHGYFVMVKKQGTNNNLSPVITQKDLRAGYISYNYEVNLSAMDGNGKTTWELTGESLPEGLALSRSGKITGIPEEEGTFSLTFRASDEDGSSAEKTLSLNILDDYPLAAVNLRTLDTAVVKNSGQHEIIIPGLANKVLNESDYIVETNSHDGIIQLDDFQNLDGQEFRLTFSTKTDLYGRDTIQFNILEKSSNNQVYTYLIINVLGYINNPPQAEPVDDLYALNKFEKNEVIIHGINDGDIGEQNLSLTINNGPSDYISIMLLDYVPNSDTAVFKFFPRPQTGVETISLTLKDDGGNDLGGTDSLVIEFDIHVIDNTGIDDQDSQEFIVYPNPATNTINIRRTNLEDFNIYITDLAGRTVYLSDNEEQIEVSDFDKGSYILFIRVNGEIKHMEQIVIR